MGDREGLKEVKQTNQYSVGTGGILGGRGRGLLEKRKKEETRAEKVRATDGTEYLKSVVSYRGGD